MCKHKKICITIILMCTFFIIIFLYLVDMPYRNSRRLVNAIRSQDIETIEELLEKGVDPNILTLSKLGRVVMGFVETGPDRPLTEACSIGNVEIVELLIDYGATAEPIEDEGWSPLPETLFFYQENDIEIVKLLLNNGADPAYDNEYYGIPVFMAAEMYPKEYDPSRANGSLYRDGYDEEVAKGVTEITMLLLEERSIDIQNSWDETLLIIATKKENRYLVNHLISIGCDTQIRDSFGKTAYDYAVETENLELIALFEK